MEDLHIIKSNYSLKKSGFENLERKWRIEGGSVKKILGKSPAEIEKSTDILAP